MRKLVTMEGFCVYLNTKAVVGDGDFPIWDAAQRERRELALTVPSVSAQVTGKVSK